MSKIIALHHITHYAYDRPIQLEPQTIRLRPAPHTRTTIQSYSLNIFPKGYFINWQQDPFGNYLARIVFPEKSKEFRVETDLIAEIKIFNPFDFFIEESAKQFPFDYDSNLRQELFPYLEIKEQGAKLLACLESVNPLPQDIIEFLVNINSKINQMLRYEIRLEAGVQSCEETLTLKKGSCRDMAWLLCQLLRHLGLATRFVSGYLIQLKADVKALDGPSGTDKDFTDLHAWTEVYLPGAGWVGLDPTSGLFAGEGHIPLCCTPNPSSASPISGGIEACQSTMTNEMTITRIHEDRRVTKPYTSSEWVAIDALGKEVDKDLEEHDVALTMGGEPTFVSLDNPSDDAWNFSALSDDKLSLGKTLMQRLKHQFSPHGLTQDSQGKWYPGESLPRWALHCYWLKNGKTIWKDAKLLADDNKNHGHTLDMAKQFISRLANKLGLPDSYVMPAHEDIPYYLWKEQRVPILDDMLKANTQEKDERKRLQALLDNDLSEVAGYVLPLQYSATRNAWISNRWQFKSGHLLLTPGDSPIGLRLPLNSLPNVKKSNDEFFPPRNRLEQRGAIATRKEFQERINARKATDKHFSKDAPGLIRNAFCVDIREGSLHVFLPPMSYIEHFLELVTAIETVASELKMPVILIGYQAPKDLRLQSFSITPDPGVLEINIQPANDWEELKTIVTTVYEEAHLSRMTTDKFLLDGRRVGTGGGNHVVLGAGSPDRSPFLRRPDLLRSMVTFWQHHPALSYLFSSMYIGPTSQAPRIDEARHDSLYELDIAFQQIPKDAEVAPWLVDRLFRNILIDLSGNTHRAEFCIDKLFSPDSDSGRLGLLEMRGFEMTPHAQMNLLQALLIRASIAVFWRAPYHHKLLRWGTQLHDQFMLPYYVKQDLADVLHHLKQYGYHFEMQWFEPFFDFRFPKYGDVQIGPVSLALRMGLEPWPVMGEESNAGSVSRSVDSSVERLEIKVTGAIPGRHVITCNGYALPLKPTDEKGVSVAGVRYKAWSPSSSLHPTIPAHTPLVFDVIDRYHERSLGGCTYHVMHPGGRHYDTLPINENEAEGRRLSRFQAMGHTPGKHIVSEPKPNPDFPYTLDLRVLP